MDLSKGNKHLKIALAEDHVMFREALCQQINTWENCQVILEAGNGRELINGLNNQAPPDIVLVDLCMPVMNGYEAIEEIKRLFPTIKILVISMYCSDEAIYRVRRAGANGFLNKMEGMEAIRTAVYKTMNSPYFITPNSIMSSILVSSHDQPSLRYNLSEEELKFLRYICTEKTYKAIAAEMGISGRHVEYLRYNLFERFNVQSRTGLAIRVMEKGLAI